nr:DUF4340 domain-containing protein [candidate division Zixibacteria bacterium]
MKRLLIPLIVLIIILIAWLVQNRMENRQMAGRTVENFLNLSAPDVNRIVIEKPDDTLEFTRDQAYWYLHDSLPRRADSMAMKNIINNGAGIVVGDVISENPERQTEFQVDTASGILIRFYHDDNLLASVITGKPSVDYAHTYVRIPGSDQVYLANGLIRYVFDRKRTQWYDKTIFSFIPGSIASVDIAYPDKAYRLSFHDSLWYISKQPYQDSLTADSMKAESFIGAIVRIDAVDFANAADSGLIDFANPSLILKVTLTDGSTHQLTFAKINAEGSRVYCKKPEFDDIFVVYKSKYANYTRQFADFMP